MIKMLVFSTCLPLRKNVVKSDCIELFIEWITKSPYYNIKNLNYNINSTDDFEYKNNNINFYIKHYKEAMLEISACRLEFNDEKALWISDCIFLLENGKKSLIIQLNCNRSDYKIKLPIVNRPYIVQKFIEKDYCEEDGNIPISDTPFESDFDYYHICVNIMKGMHSYTLPVVYISCDYYNQTIINPYYVAKKLSGVAHIFFEKSHETAQKLRNDTNGNNVYTGYIGIYFPNTSYCQKFSIDYYKNSKSMTAAIINSVFQALVNRLDYQKYNWNHIVTLKTKQKMYNEMQDITAKQLSEYIDTFDQENKSLREQIDNLTKENYSLKAKYEALLDSRNENSENNYFYKAGKEPSLYINEKNDLLYNILSQVKDKYNRNSRPYILIESLLLSNPNSGKCEEIVSGLKEIFYSGNGLTKPNKTKLKELGFTIEEDGPHYKIIFHDPRYMFSVSKTPSDHREGKNLFSDICKKIDITKKI